MDGARDGTGTGDVFFAVGCLCFCFCSDDEGREDGMVLGVRSHPWDGSLTTGRFVGGW